MSEAFDKVRGLSELPLFPLPVVLYPGTPLPLHVFEPRYRRMLSDVQAGNNMFGMVYFDVSEAETDRPAVGQVGCVTEVVEVQTLDDGRSNILTVGLIRYRIEEYVDADEPYIVCRASFFEDEREDERALERLARQVSSLFVRIARAMRTINDERTSLPDLPDSDPERLSFLIASAMELDVEAKQELLETRSTIERLTRISALLGQAATGYEERARVHGVAKSNGHAGKKLDLE
ncbi:MAG: LON peptidase substrate-binding domain-containing protein [Pyrinomonadaceae bacterium]|nr:LON peptidase substrate-binding domain-containing protein [Pyrinomonadaceae bacterium]